MAFSLYLSRGGVSLWNVYSQSFPCSLWLALSSEWSAHFCSHFRAFLDPKLFHVPYVISSRPTNHMAGFFRATVLLIGLIFSVFFPAAMTSTWLSLREGGFVLAHGLGMYCIMVRKMRQGHGSGNFRISEDQEAERSVGRSGYIILKVLPTPKLHSSS